MNKLAAEFRFFSYTLSTQIKNETKKQKEIKTWYVGGLTNLERISKINFF